MVVPMKANQHRAKMAITMSNNKKTTRHHHHVNTVVVDVVLLKSKNVTSSKLLPATMLTSQRGSSTTSMATDRSNNFPFGSQKWLCWSILMMSLITPSSTTTSSSSVQEVLTKATMVSVSNERIYILNENRPCPVCLKDVVDGSSGSSSITFPNRTLFGNVTCADLDHWGRIDLLWDDLNCELLHYVTHLSSLCGCLQSEGAKPTTSTNAISLAPPTLAPSMSLGSRRQLLQVEPSPSIRMMISKNTTNSTIVHPECYICGSSQEFVTNYDAVLSLDTSILYHQSSSHVINITCGQLEQLGLYDSNVMETSVCSTLLQSITNLSNICGCRQVHDNNHNGTNSPYCSEGDEEDFGSSGNNATSTMNNNNGVLSSSHVLQMNEILLDQLYPSNTSLSYCSYFYNAGAWYRFNGMGAMIAIHTCHLSEVPTKVLLLEGGNDITHNQSLSSLSCNNLTCTVATILPCLSTSWDGSHNNHDPNLYGGSAAVFYAKPNVEYRILVAVDVDLLSSSSTQSSPTVAPASITTANNKTTTTNNGMENEYYFALTASYPCHVCGAMNQQVTNLGATVPIPSPTYYTLSSLDTFNDSVINRTTTCYDLQRQGWFGLIDNTTCKSISNMIQQTCGCQTFVVGPQLCPYGVTIQLGEVVYGKARLRQYSVVLDDISQFGITSQARAWYRFEGTDQMVTISTCQYVVDYYTEIIVFQDDSTNATQCHNMTYIDRGSLGCDNFNIYGSSVSWYAALNHVYWILVAGDMTAIRTFVLTLTADAPGPTLSPTKKNHPVCNICGNNNDGYLIYPLSIVDLGPPYGNVTCGDLQYAGLNGFIDPNSCPYLLEKNITQTVCGCYYPGPVVCDNATTIVPGETIYGTMWPPRSDEDGGQNYTFCNVSVSDPVWYRFMGIGANVSINVQSCLASAVVVQGNCSAIESSTMMTTTTTLSSTMAPHGGVVSSDAAGVTCLGFEDNLCTFNINFVPQITWYSVLGQSYYILIYPNTYIYTELDGNYILTLEEVTNQPSPIFPICYICGSDLEHVTLPNATVTRNTPSTNYSITCSGLEHGGLARKIEPTICSAILQQHDLRTTCGCQRVKDDTKNSTILNGTTTQQPICPPSAAAGNPSQPCSDQPADSIHSPPASSGQTQSCRAGNQGFFIFMVVAVLNYWLWHSIL